VTVCIGLALGVTGCGGHSRRARTPVRTLSIYTSLPFEGPYGASSRSIYDAEQLALAQAGGVVNGFKVVLKRLDDASSATGRPDPATVAQNARIAAADASTVAYIGELAPGSSRDSIPILSRAGILQVSPGDTATSLTGRTFARVVPPDSEEALAQLAVMRSRGVKSLYLIRDRTMFGADIATVVLDNAATYGINVADPAGKYLGADIRPLVRAIKRSKADAVLYAGEPAVGVPAFWNSVSASEPRIRKFAPATITGMASWGATTVLARENTFLIAPGLPRAELPRAGSQFVTEFRATYGSRVEWASGIFGYVAMSGILRTLYALGPRAGDQRDKLVTAFLNTKSLPSAIGDYSIVDGQTTFQSYFFTGYDRSGLPIALSPAPGEL